MKKIGILGLSLLMGMGLLHAQATQEYNLGSFDNIDLDGNIRLYLEYDKKPSVVIEAKKDYYIDDYEVEVRHNTLIIRHDEHGDSWGSTPKINVYVAHPGIHELDMDGLVSVYTKDVVKTERLKIKGDGLIRGDIDVIVDRLIIGLDGMGKMTVVGRATESDLSVDGMGSIDARGLQGRITSSTDGLASIKTPR